MAILTIALRRDVLTNQTTVRVEFCSPADALPHEHELAHREYVSALLPGAAVERERPAREPVVG